MVSLGEIWWYEHPDVGRRPYLILTRVEACAVWPQVMGVPATTVIRNIPTEVILDTRDGMPHRCALTLDNVTDSEMEAALPRRAHAGVAERDIYAAYVHEHFLTALERHADKIVFQFSLGAEPLPFETGSRLNQRTIGELGDMMARHPRLRFQCFLASRHANQSLCTLARELLARESALPASTEPQHG